MMLSTYSKTKIIINLGIISSGMAKRSLDAKIKTRIKKQIKDEIKRQPILQRAVTDAATLYEGKGMKQVILMRKDLKLPAGKAAAQAAHASVEAVLKSNSLVVRKWREGGAKKVVLRIDSVKEVYEYARVAEDDGLAVAIITDAGRTVIAPGTVTCCAIGPSDEKVIDRITGKLKMY